MRKILLAAWFSFGSLLATAAPMPPRSPFDDSQARAMVVFLRAVAEHGDASKLVDPLMTMPGTATLIAQQNISRRVTPAEYREVLLAVAEHREPSLDVDAADPRARKGKEGLLHDVLPSLRWGCQHAELLAERLAAVERLDVASQASRLARDNLPETVPLQVPLYLVMGGRAGAAATDRGIYFDVLSMSFRDPGHYPAPTQIVEFFAHEMHHVGLGRILDDREARLHLDLNGRRAFDLLRGLVMEGSASYLINGHRNLQAMRDDPRFAAPGDDLSRLAAVEQVLAGVLRQDWTAEHYDQAMTQFDGNMLHITGATMLDAIWRAGGRRAVMAVLHDPCQLLVRYDQSVGSHPQAFRFSGSLARQIASLGR